MTDREAQTSSGIATCPPSQTPLLTGQTHYRIIHAMSTDIDTPFRILHAITVGLVMDNIEVGTVPGPPQPWQRAGGSGKRRFTQPKHSAAANSVLASYLGNRKRIEPRAGLVALACAFVFPSPRPAVVRAGGANTPSGHFTFANNRTDVDNLLKLVADALNGYAYLDDRQISVAIGIKLYGPKAMTCYQIANLSRIRKDVIHEPVPVS